MPAKERRLNNIEDREGHDEFTFQLVCLCSFLITSVCDGPPTLAMSFATGRSTNIAGTARCFSKSS